MKIERLMQLMTFIKGLKGDIHLYDISEYKGKTFLDFLCDFPPYEITYTSEEVTGCFHGGDKAINSVINEIYMDEDGIPITNSFCIGENGDMLTDS